MNESALKVIAELYPKYGVELWRHVQWYDPETEKWFLCEESRDLVISDHYKYRVKPNTHIVNGIECPAPLIDVLEKSKGKRNELERKIERLEDEMDNLEFEMQGYAAALLVAQERAAKAEERVNDLEGMIDYKNLWMLTEKHPPPSGEAVIGYHPDWVNDDFNPTGVRECFRYGDGSDWNCAFWFDEQDTYTTEHSVPKYWTTYPDAPASDTWDGAKIDKNRFKFGIYLNEENLKANLKAHYPHLEL